jgi:hypothetical protein
MKNINFHIFIVKMDQKRRQLNIEELRVQIMRADKCQQRDTDVLKNIHKVNMSDEFLQKKKEGLMNTINRRAEELINLQNRSRDISEGKLDKEIAEAVEMQSKLFYEKRESALKKKKENLQEDAERKKMMYKKPREKENKHIEKDYAYFHKVYNSICDSFPRHMKDNLRTMPNNKGYIWRGCLFLGDLPAERGQPMISFEKTRGGLQKIYETDQYETRVYEKQGKDRKYIVSRKNRNNYKIR